MPAIPGLPLHADRHVGGDGGHYEAVARVAVDGTEEPGQEPARRAVVHHRHPYGHERDEVEEVRDRLDAELEVVPGA